MPGEPEGLTAVLLQLAGITQKLSEFDQRQAGDTRELKERIAGLASLVSELKGTTASHTQTLAALDGLDRQIAELAAKTASHDPDGDSDRSAYQPSAAPKFWKLDGPARDQAISKLRAWVDQVYRPGYGHLAASLGDCWEQHPLCLYILDWLAELWSVLYLAPTHRGNAGRPGRMAHPAASRGGRATRPRDSRLHPRHQPLPHRAHGSAAMTARPPDRTVERALAYAAHGWPVFPCQPGGKQPTTRHGFHNATTEPDKITWWWRRQPDANLAIATGQPGPDVLDVDQHGPAGNGFAAFNQLQRAGLIDGAGAIVATPSGGLHAYFAGSDQHSGKLPSHHLDFRAQGGYIVAPPSQVGGRPYQVISHRDDPGGLDWAKVTGLLEPQRHTVLQPPRVQRGDLSHLAAWVQQQHEGNRNDGLFWAACRVAEASDETVLAELAAAARSTGLTDREIAATIKSARRTAGRPVEHQGGREATS